MRRRSLFENSIFANKHSDRGRRKGLVSGEDDARLGLLQVALQAAATHWYQHLHKIVRQKTTDVAKRWRVITQKSLFASDGDDETELLSSLYNALDAVIKAAACDLKNVNVGADLQQALHEGIQVVARLNLQLRRDISIGITSIDTQLSTIHPRPGQRYHSAIMEAQDADQQRRDVTVGCGVSLVLVRNLGTSQRHTLIKSTVLIVHE
ncbi:hypothetical protein K523DRAFT_418444 [Schizophyllum commune Tattone D]|nr:hypothetical protein K523DRAFT_418444 [Schizophyllum commune Tattone D]